jgi:hypothetical protein
MKTKRSFMRFAVLGTFALLVAGFMVPATAWADTTPVVWQLTSDHCTGGCGTPPFGTVSLVQNGANVDITVHLLNGNLFVKTGSADFQNFKFNGVGVALSDITVNQTVPGNTLVAATGAFNGDGTGNFIFGINCSTCGNGAGPGNAFSQDIVFHVANATIADLSQPNNLGNIFVADIWSAQTGNTGPVDASGSPIPEPSTIFLYGLGVAMLVAGHKWRKNSLVGNGGDFVR